jgi:glycosyltransferase involved in cell wall biosynthesis
MAPAQRLSVAMVSFDFGEVCVPIANALSESADVTLILPHHELEPLAEELLPGVRAVTFRKPRLRQPLRQVLMCRTILRALAGCEPDLIHLQQGHLWFNLIGLRRLGARPLVVTIHDPEAHVGDRGGRKTPQAAMNLAFRRADQLIVHAERLREAVERRHGIPEAMIHVIPHVAIGGVDESPVARDDGRTVLFFGRIWPYKGLDHLIRAEPLISARVSDVRFVIAGRGEDLGRYRAMMRHPDRFTVINDFVPNERRAELFAEAAVVVLPYVEASQSGVVPIAYAHEKPVVATSVGGLPEAVEDGRTGFVVPPRDERALADAVARLLEDEPLRRAFGAAARRKLEDEWSAAKVARDTLRVYELAVGTDLPVVAAVR